MRLQKLAEAFRGSDSTEPVLIICKNDEIKSLFKELEENKDFAQGHNYGKFSNKETIASKLGVQSIFIEGREIHFIPSENKINFFELMTKE